MIKCPYQPGQLVLSKHSCAKRHLAAMEESFEDLMDLDVFRYRVKKGLFLCRQCTIGQRLASQLGVGPIADAQPLQAAGS
jgi:hypothetical protein